MSIIARNVTWLALGCAFLVGCHHNDGLNVGSPAMRKACSDYTDIYRLRQANCYGVTSPPDLAMQPLICPRKPPSGGRPALRLRRPVRMSGSC